mmetsp:Transcript_4874/g.13435  ORF Transcript_4874/g.13435 Transcript_4874/m.13435 type:complete len:237 (+) Transcript_4874:173-883(+)
MRRLNVVFPVTSCATALPRKGTSATLAGLPETVTARTRTVTGPGVPSIVTWMGGMRHVLNQKKGCSGDGSRRKGRARSTCEMRRRCAGGGTARRVPPSSTRASQAMSASCTGGISAPLSGPGDARLAGDALCSREDEAAACGACCFAWSGARVPSRCPCASWALWGSVSWGLCCSHAAAVPACGCVNGARFGGGAAEVESPNPWEEVCAGRGCSTGATAPRGDKSGDVMAPLMSGR